MQEELSPTAPSRIVLFVAVVSAACAVTARLGWAAVAQFGDRVLVTPTGVSDRVARPGSQMLMAWALAGLMTVLAGSCVAGAVSPRGWRRAQGTSTALALVVSGLTATALGVLAARTQGYERSRSTYLLVAAVTVPLVVAAIAASRVVVARRWRQEKPLEPARTAALSHR